MPSYATFFVQAPSSGDRKRPAPVSDASPPAKKQNSPQINKAATNPGAGEAACNGGDEAWATLTVKDIKPYTDGRPTRQWGRANKALAQHVQGKCITKAKEALQVVADSRIKHWIDLLKQNINIDCKKATAEHRAALTKDDRHGAWRKEYASRMLRVHLDDLCNLIKEDIKLRTVEAHWKLVPVWLEVCSCHWLEWAKSPAVEALAHSVLDAWVSPSKRKS